MVIEVGGWVIPAVITVFSFGYAIFGVKDTGGYLSGINNLFAMIPAGIISTLSWIVYAILK